MSAALSGAARMGIPERPSAAASASRDPLAGRTVAVTGAGGYVARRLRERLSRAGARTVCVSRRRLRRLFPAERHVLTDGYSADDLAAALEGCSALVHLAGSGRVGPDGAPYCETNGAVAARAAAACDKAASAAGRGRGRRGRGMERIVYLSGLGVSASPTTSYFASKLSAERALASSAVPCTVLRPSFIVGRGDPLSRSLARQARRYGAVLVPGSGPHRTQPVHIDDACAALLAALRLPRLAGAVLDLVGPRTVPYRRLAAALAPPGAPLRTVPLAEAYRSALRDPSYAYGVDDLDIIVGGFTGDHEGLRRAAGLGPFTETEYVLRAYDRTRLRRADDLGPFTDAVRASQRRPRGRPPCQERPSCLSAPTQTPPGQSGRTRPSASTRAS